MGLPDIPTTALLDEIARTELPQLDPLMFYLGATGLLVAGWILGRLIARIIDSSKLTDQPS